MLYNIKEKAKQTKIQCLKCKCYDKENHKCNGINKICFLYDEKTDTIVDSLTGLAIKIDLKGDEE